MDLHDVRRELNNKVFLGVVEETYDPKRRGRIKIRIDKLHGKADIDDNISTEDLPWASPNLSNTGVSFGIPPIGKVLYVTFVDGDWYNPVFSASEHYNINLQKKLQDLSEEEYLGFGANVFDADHQYYNDINDGLIFDFVKSNLNFRNNGDIRVNLRDNSAKLFLGTEDASEPAVLGNHWMNWFDEFVDNLIGAFGGPYLGNMGAPVIPHPKMIEALNKYKAIRATFLSDHVFITDDQRVIAQDRRYDDPQIGDSYNDENQERVPEIRQSGYTPEQRKTGNEIPSTDVPTTESVDNLQSAKLPANPTPKEANRLKKPFSQSFGNGEIPTEQLTTSKELQKTFPSSDDERKFLLDEAARSLDEMISDYRIHSKNTDWSDIMAIKGYQNLDRQKNIRETQPSIAPLTGNDPFGWANQVELYWGINKRNVSLVNSVREYIKTRIVKEDSPEEILILDWLYNNSKKYNWENSGRTNIGQTQWWSWIYVPS